MKPTAAKILGLAFLAAATGAEAQGFNHHHHNHRYNPNYYRPPLQVDPYLIPFAIAPLTIWGLDQALTPRYEPRYYRLPPQVFDPPGSNSAPTPPYGAYNYPEGHGSCLVYGVKDLPNGRKSIYCLEP